MKNFLFFPHFQLNGLVVHTTHFMHSSKKRAYRKQVGEKVRVGSREREWTTTTMYMEKGVKGEGAGVKIQQWVGVTRRQQKTIDRKVKTGGLWG